MSESRDAEQAAAERRQRAVQVQSGAARAAVLGVNDGLVTNTALILGVVGATDATDLVRALGVYSRAVLGVNPDELGSPWTTALFSSVAFAMGALVPLLPWYIVPRPTAIAASLALSGLAA